MQDQWKNELENYLFSSPIENLNLQSAISIKNGNVPKRLFKYRKAVDQRTLENLENDKLWCAKPSTFNDPYDSALCINNFEAEYFKDSKEYTSFLFEKSNSDLKSELERTMAQNPSFIDESLLSFINNQKKNIDYHIEEFNKNKDVCKICCFTENLDSVLMWSHYAAAHTGFVVEYNFSDLPITDFKYQYLFPVFYRQELFDLKRFLEFHRRTGKYNECAYVIPALSKALNWKYESEWRLLLPYGTKLPPGTIPSPIPTAIFFGARISKYDRNNLIQIAEDKKLSYYDMKLDNYEFKMTPKIIKLFASKSFQNTMYQWDYPKINF